LNIVTKRKTRIFQEGVKKASREHKYAQADGLIDIFSNLEAAELTGRMLVQAF
jgi:hypothetical protein